MKTKIQLTEIEKEICGSIAPGLLGSEGENIFLSCDSYEAKEIISRVEEVIHQQEGDHGDWLRAKDWREAAPGLIGKLRLIALMCVKQIL